MFREVGVSLTWRFDDALRNAKQDGRFKYLKMSMQTKKQVFAQYREEVRDEEREQANLKRRRQRDFFFDLLSEHKEAMGLNSSSKFYQISKKLAQRDQKKFMAVDEQERDEIF